MRQWIQKLTPFSLNMACKLAITKGQSISMLPAGHKNQLLSVRNFNITLTQRNYAHSQFIANPTIYSLPFPIGVEEKRGQNGAGEFIPARLIIDEPGCYNRVVNQLQGYQVNIGFHSRIETDEDDDKGVVQFASSWESVEALIYKTDTPAAPSVQTTQDPADALFDFISGVKGPTITPRMAENFKASIANESPVRQRATNGMSPALTCKSYQGF